MLKYKITIKRDLCIGAGSCLAIAAATFNLDSENKAVVLDEGGDNMESILLAAQSCPTKSIILEDIVSGKQEYP